MSSTWSRRVLAILTLYTACLAGVAAWALASPAITARTPDEAASPRPVDASAVNDAFAAVAATRERAADQVDAELRAGVRVEPMAQALRSPSTVDATLEEVPVVVALFDRTDLEATAPTLDDLEADLDRAEEAVADAAAQVADDSWEASFLEAQQEVVAALRAWNEASRDVHRVVAAEWEQWRGIVDAAAVLDEDRWRYRSEEEAAGTWEIEVEDRVAALEEASAALAAAAEARDDAATAVAAADARVAEVFAERPSSPPAAP